MNRCILTKLPSTFNDDSLIRFDELPITLKKLAADSNDDQYMRLTVTGKQTARIVGDAHFQNSTRTEDLGQDIELSEGPNYIYLTNENGTLYISGKSLITQLILGRSGYRPLCSVALSEVKYCSDNFGYLIGLTGGAFGDIQEISELTKIYYLSMAASNVYGDVSAFENLNDLAYISLAGCPNIIGDIAVFKDKSALTYLGFGGCPGIDSVDLSEFRDLTNLYNIKLSNTVSMEYTASSGRSSDSVVIALEGANLGSDIDNYLIDNAGCTKSPSTSLISVYGSRTSASNAAVTSLKNKGYVIQVNGVNQ